MTTEKITFLILIILQSSYSTKISKTSAEIIFEPIGNIIPELSWANIRVTLNITTMFEENNDLCRAHSQLRTEGKTFLPKLYKGDKDNQNYQLIIDMTNNLKHSCLENTYIIDEVADVFGVKNYQRPEYLPKRISNNLYNMHKTKSKRENRNGIIRKARQVLIGIGIAAVGIITSLVSIFSTK